MVVKERLAKNKVKERESDTWRRIKKGGFVEGFQRREGEKET